MSILFELPIDLKYIFLYLASLLCFQLSTFYSFYLLFSAMAAYLGMHTSVALRY